MKKITFLKKIVILTIIITILLSSSITYAYEAKYEYYANMLKVINVFRGTNLGFELEREPTRIEGGVMFVRLLGGENEALARNYEHPFKDVPEWADPYVGYLYKYNLTNGVSSDVFGSSLNMQAKSYITFILRALGYDDSIGDFTWHNALEYAFSHGLINQEVYQELKGDIFYRDQVAKLSYDALFSKLKSYEATLGEKMVSQGAISKVAANSIGIIDDYYLNSAKPISIFGLNLEDTYEQLIATMGIPNDIVNSRLDFQWYIYNYDYSNYVQFGVKDGVIVAFYTVSPLLRTDKQVTIGNTKEEILEAYISPIKSIEKKIEGDNTIYLWYPTGNDSEMFLLSDFKGYVTYFYDTYDGNKVYATLVMDKKIEQSHITPYLLPTEQLIETTERQTLYITNAVRSINGVGILEWSEKAHISTTKHCLDMIERDYFAHISPDGVTPFTRMKNEGINYSLAGENLAFGFYDAINSVQAWYNSKTGHRENLLDDYLYVGVGVAFKGNAMYIAQNFWR